MAILAIMQDKTITREKYERCGRSAGENNRPVGAQFPLAPSRKRQAARVEVWDLPEQLEVFFPSASNPVCSSWSFGSASRGLSGA